MAKIISSKTRRQPKKVGDVEVISGNAREMGGFKHFRVGHELARPTTLVDGTEAYVTPNGRKFKVTKIQ